jgi:hypothetical protein
LRTHFRALSCYRLAPREIRHRALAEHRKLTKLNRYCHSFRCKTFIAFAAGFFERYVSLAASLGSMTLYHLKNSIGAGAKKNAGGCPHGTSRSRSRKVRQEPARDRMRPMRRRTVRP